ncbi:uncharacterized protein LOC119373509 isoform X1 [Rhipicephalus sanguineus]|uniref:uncharacterized protein LOC119373509 isoform X1 n=1 Tax=Rhipicephalus sanguineus TaxID=34632 RepID=UPI001894A802|nr:uncharacterized protein LOC119373509 isoform X1 [Rhipicephalus sanguineus]
MGVKRKPPLMGMRLRRLPVGQRWTDRKEEKEKKKRRNKQVDLRPRQQERLQQLRHRPRHRQSHQAVAVARQRSKGLGLKAKARKKGGKRGPRRCRLSPTKSNCIGKGNFKLWYYNASSQLCERHKVGGCPKLIGGFVFCPECMNWCNKRINAKKACLGVK